MNEKLTIGIAVIMAGIALTTMSTGTASASITGATGAVTSDAVSNDYQTGGSHDDQLPGASEHGYHAADPSGDGITPDEDGPNADSERVGLANVIERGAGADTTITTICTNLDPSAAGCDAIR